MIKVSCNNGHVNVCVEGKLIELIADTALVVKGIYDNIKDADEDAAAEWKKQFDNGYFYKCVFEPEAIMREAMSDMDKLVELLKLLNDVE